MIYNETPRRKQITEQVSWGHWFALANILIAIAISSIYLFSTPVTTTPISFVYMLATWLGHTSFIAFLGFVIFVLPLCYQLHNIRLLRGIAATVAAIALALLAFDALIYNQTGFHLSFSSAQLLRLETRAQVGAFGWLQWFYFGMLFIIWLMLQLVIANAIYKRLRRFQKLKLSPYITTFFVICFVSSHGIHVWADARLYSPILKQDNMFPLSYPATAKTLMARYGLLDLDLREQQEELQYQVGNGFRYPPLPVYCSVKNDPKVVLLASMEAQAYPLLETLQSNEFHLVTEDDSARFKKQVEYAIPYNLARLTTVAPVLLDLLNAFDVESHTVISNDNEEAFNTFVEKMQSTEHGLFFAIMSGAQLAKVTQTMLGQSTQIMVVAKTDENSNFKLYSNFLENNTPSTNEDLAPTILQAFGCMADVKRYSTGQALQSPKRSWLVSSKEDNLVFVNYPLLTEVARDGSYKVTDLRNNQEILSDIDTNMLSRSIKHLETFAN